MFKKRRQQDRFYWYINDVVMSAHKYGYGIPWPHGYAGAATFEGCAEYDPELTLKGWFDYVSRYITTEQLERDWREYWRSPDPNETMSLVSDPPT